MTACGGGGGGSAAPAAVTYTGAITPATLTNTNAEAIALGGYVGGEMGTNLSIAGVETASLTDGSAATIQSRPQVLAKALAEAMRQVDVTAAPAPTPAMPAGVRNWGQIYLLLIKESSVIEIACHAWAD